MTSTIIFENKAALIEISSDDSRVMRIWDKTNSKDITGSVCHFFSLVTEDKKTEVYPDKILLSEDVLHIKTALGNFKIRFQCHDDFFVFTLASALPAGVFKAQLAHAKYNYDYTDKQNCGAVGIAMTYWANPCFFPDSKSLETKAEVMPALMDKGAKYALIVAPISTHRQLIKKASRLIDRRFGIVSECGGAWATDCVLNFGNSIIQYDSSAEFIEENIDFFTRLGVDQIDFHKGDETFCQGDFTFKHYKNAGEFKENVSDTLAKHNICSGLHTYSAYIDFSCETLTAMPQWQKDLSVLERFTLDRDTDEYSSSLKVAESTDSVSTNYGFLSRNTKYILVGEEIMEFTDSKNGFNGLRRGACGTKAIPHKKGEAVLHLDGYYHGFAPVPGSELFFQIARNTAKIFNEGGFKTIYLDALEGISKHCGGPEYSWFYYAAFICELLYHCETDPMIEHSTICPSIWASRGRYGAYDTPWRGYKKWNQRHIEINQTFVDRFATTTLGWYNFYPITEKYPGNEHTKYHHTDTTHHLGSLSLAFNTSMVYNDISKDDPDKYPALKRNIEIFKKYDDLRKSSFFGEDVLEKIRSGRYEYHLSSYAGRPCFTEKSFDTKKLYNLSDSTANSAEFNNPFKEQKPFVRIEALLSTQRSDPIVLLDMDPQKEICDQAAENTFAEETDLSTHLAKTVSLCGNKKAGSAVAIRMYCNSGSELGVLEYFIDTDYDGWRDFVLIETDNGQRPDLPFDNDANCKFYAIYRSSFHHERATKITVEASDNADGIKLSPVIAYRHTYAALNNPAITINNKKVTFVCSLKSTDFIEFDGRCAKVIDRYGNEQPIEFNGSVSAPSGKFEASLTADNTEDSVLRAQLTFGFEGNRL